MPVPASYNDITVSSEVRDFLGWAWYQRSFQLTEDWQGKRLVLRFGSVHHTARVFLNGQEVGGHTGGHMAFEMPVTEAVIVLCFELSIATSVYVSAPIWVPISPRFALWGSVARWFHILW